jgi:hypothetical protein
MQGFANPKATNTHLEYIIPIAFPLQEWLCKRSSMLRYTHIVCVCVFFLRKRRKGLTLCGQWQRYSLVNAHGNKTVSKHSHFTRTSTSTVTRQLQTAKPKHSREYNKTSHPTCSSIRDRSDVLCDLEHFLCRYAR